MLRVGGSAWRVNGVGRYGVPSDPKKVHWVAARWVTVWGVRLELTRGQWLTY